MSGAGMSGSLSIALIAAAFLAGAIPFGVLIARRRGVDIRAHGSGNIGATNVSRVLGARAGVIVLVLDALKGALPTAAARAAAAAPVSPGSYDDARVVALTGLAAILGHCFSPFLRGRGGKGVATALGVFAVIAPAHVGIGVGAFAAVLAVTRVPALGSLAAALAIAVGLAVSEGASPDAALAGATFALLVYTHRTNLGKLRQRLRERRAQGREP